MFSLGTSLCYQHEKLLERCESHVKSLEEKIPKEGFANCAALIPSDNDWADQPCSETKLNVDSWNVYKGSTTTATTYRLL